MVNPGAFRGARKDFLLQEKATYNAGVIGGYAADALAKIQLRYFKRFPIDLADDEEPDAETLASIDDDIPDFEDEEPDPTLLEAEEYATAMQELEARRKAIAFQRGQIKWWLAYQHMKDSDMGSKDSSAQNSQNPYRVLLHKLTGTTIQCPRRRTPVNVWRKTQCDAIEHEVKARAAVLGTHRNGMAALRDKVAKQLYGKLSDEEKAQWQEQAEVEHNATVEAWKEETMNSASTDPVDRQRCIYGLVQFAQPILDLICEATGWKATLITGGPEPAHGGRLNVISIHSGTTTGDIKMNFGRAEHLRYKNTIVPIFGNFLQKCYSPEECREHALPDVEGLEGFDGIESMDLDAQGVNFDSVDVGTPSVSPSTPTEQPVLPTATSIAPQPPTSAQPMSLTVASTDSSDPQSASPAFRNQSRSLSRGPSPALSTRISPLPDAPSPTSSIGSILRHDLPASPSANAYALRPYVPPSPLPDAGITTSMPPSPNTAADANIPGESATPSLEARHATPTPLSPTHAGFSNTRGKKRLADAIADSPCTSKRTRTASDLSVRSSAPDTQTNVPLHSTPVSKQTRTARVESTIPESTAPPTSSTQSTHALEGASSSTAKLSASPNAPAWFSNALEMLQGDNADLGRSWEKLVSLWATFEAKETYGANMVGKLKAKHRPLVLKDWIQRARSAKWRPVISNVGAMGEDFACWWTSLQPEWRIGDGGVLDVTTIDGNWEELRRPGVNGLLSVLAGLFFWGLGARGNIAMHQEWLSFVNDCISAFTGLLAAS